MARAPGRTSGEGSFDVYGEFDQAKVNALKRAIKDVGPEARKEVRAQLKAVGQIGQRSIQERTPVYGGSGYGKGKSARRASVTLHGATQSKTYKATHSPGLLKKSTRLKIGSLSVTIYNSAKAVSRKYPGGYRYGKRIEFDPRLGGRYAFFYPGWDAVKGQARAAFGKVLEAAARAYMKP